MSEKTSRAVRAPLAVLALAPAPGPRDRGVRWHEAQATVSVRGELDRDAVWAIDYTISRAAMDAGRIVLDLREVTHLDSAGVPALVERRSELRARGGDLRIAVRNPYVAKILAMASGSELQICRDPEEAFEEARVSVRSRLQAYATGDAGDAGSSSVCSRLRRTPVAGEAGSSCVTRARRRQ